MNPEDIRTKTGFQFIEAEGKSEFDMELEEAEKFFNDYPGNEGLTCLVCGAAVNMGFQHIRWHKGAQR